MTAPGEKTAAIGIDRGGTKSEVVLLSEDDTVLFRARRATPRQDGSDLLGDPSGVFGAAWTGQGALV